MIIQCTIVIAKRLPIELPGRLIMNRNLLLWEKSNNYAEPACHLNSKLDYPA